MGFAAPLTLDFACFGFVRFAAFLRAGLALALPRLELFLRVATPKADIAGGPHQGPFVLLIEDALSSRGF
jgi:hypothetical protein